MRRSYLRSDVSHRDKVLENTAITLPNAIDAVPSVTRFEFFVPLISG